MTEQRTEPRSPPALPKTVKVPGLAPKSPTTCYAVQLSNW